MADIFSQLVKQLIDSGLDRDEATLYAELSKAPSTHLKLSRATNISRTKVYRIADRLEKRGILIRRSDDRGKFLVAGDLGLLSEDSRRRQAAALAEQTALEKAMSLASLLGSEVANDFIVHTYTGVEGMRQMQWHELKTKKELLALGYVTYEELGGGHQWAEHFRARVAEAGYKTRELIGRMPSSFQVHYTSIDAYSELYSARRLSGNTLPIHAPMVIYNDTVAIYQVDSERLFGIEIIHAGFAQTMAHIFEHYWSLADDIDIETLQG